MRPRNPSRAADRRAREESRRGALELRAARAGELRSNSGTGSRDRSSNASNAGSLTSSRRGSRSETSLAPLDLAPNAPPREVQDSLRDAIIEARNGPQLPPLVDAETGEPIVIRSTADIDAEFADLWRREDERERREKWHCGGLGLRLCCPGANNFLPHRDWLGATCGRETCERKLERD